MIQSDELHHFSGGRSTTNQSSYPLHIPIQCHCHSLLHGRPEDYARDGYDATQVCCACGSGTVEAGNVPFASQDRVLSYAATGGTQKKWFPLLKNGGFLNVTSLEWLGFGEFSQHRRKNQHDPTGMVPLGDF